MRKWKPVIGIILILVSTAGLFFWEWKGREAILMDRVLVAKEDISAGTLADEKLFRSESIQSEARIDGAVKEEELEVLLGKKAEHDIVKNGQISVRYFGTDAFKLKPGESIYVIQPEWIRMRSSSIRRGDQIDLFTEDGVNKLGTYLVAFVKDSGEREVMNVDGTERAALLERTDGTSVISHIELICTLADYQAIRSCAENSSGGALLVIQNQSEGDMRRAVQKDKEGGKMAG